MRALWFLPLLAAFEGAVGSSGDRLPAFQQCISRCARLQHTPSDLAQRVTRWTVQDECNYACMHSVTDKLSSQGERVHQFYGKWPFWRLAGMQEPASVLFSLLNLAAHAQGVRDVRRSVSKGHPMRRFVTLWGFVAINAWTWSAVFHTRDKPFTERMDYISAGASIFYSLFLAAVRVFGLWDAPGRARLTATADATTHRRWMPLALFISAMFAAHVLYATRNPRFDYGYNIKACVAVGMLHNAIWVFYSWRERRFRRAGVPVSRPYTIQPAIAVLVTTAAMGFELLDFPAWRRVIDAHALWHLSTVPIVVYWYRFLVKDSIDETQWAREKLPP
ncbi:Per1-like protein [Auriculariales sp. MPI-PUGE-AT-0066]|nr:Per1-like protein [Auriculariales sp. MPI-PUGE-AT-0066]